MQTDAAGCTRQAVSGVHSLCSHRSCCHAGAGKTTFLTALCGKASYGTLSGSVMINGEPGLLTDAKYKHLVAFVPQEDIMMRDLTVEGGCGRAAAPRVWLATHCSCRRAWFGVPAAHRVQRILPSPP